MKSTRTNKTATSIRLSKDAITLTDYLLARLCVDLEKMLTDPPKISEIRSVLRSFATMASKEEKKAEKAANTAEEIKLAEDTREVYFYWPCECLSPSYYKINKTLEEYNRLYEIVRRDGKDAVMNAMRPIVESGSYIPSLTKFLDRYLAPAPKPTAEEEKKLLDKSIYQDVR